MNSNSLIKLEDVWKIYNLGKIDIQVLKSINLEIFEKEFIVIFGRSGSGKSTLLNLISCLDIPTKGKVFLKNNDITKISEDDLANIRGKEIGFIFQQFNLLAHLTALENVALPAVFQGIKEEKRIENAKKLLEIVGLSSRLNHRPNELSGGERQRVAIARSLINDPKIIVADEPTGNVDSKTGRIIMDILKKLNKEDQRTVILVTHDLNLIQNNNRVIEIKDGEII